MAGRRLIPRHVVEAWERRLRDAVLRALDEMLAATRRQMAITAAGDVGRKVGAGALAGVAVYNVWSDVAWARLVDQHVAPVADDLEGEAGDYAASAIGGTAVWGFSMSGAISSAVVSSALSSGNYLGARLTDAAQSEDPSAAVDRVLGTAAAIVGGIIGAMAVAIANAATSEAGQYAASSASSDYGGATQTWNSMDDDRTREAHLDADGQEVAVGESFIVDGEELAYPGDPSGSDENTINCRCWVTTDGLPSSIEDYTGDPMYGLPPSAGDVSAEAA